MERKVAHSWSPITDLPGDGKGLPTADLATLRRLWIGQVDRLDQRGEKRSFLDKLTTSLAIDTGVIEGLYTLDRGTTETLIEHGVDAALIAHDSTNRGPELVAAMVRDHEEAVEQVFAFVKGQRQLTTAYVKELHALLTRHQTTTEKVDQFGNRFESPLRRGEYKLLPNNPRLPDGALHEYCPPEQVASEMDRLLELHLEHGKKGVPVIVEAAWLHHRFTQIHPFEDGNGRVARMLATLVFLRDRWPPLNVSRDDRKRYIDALRAADRGELGPLVAVFESIQSRSMSLAFQASGRRPSRSAGEELSRLKAELGTAPPSAGALLERISSDTTGRLTALRRDLGSLGSAFAEVDSVAISELIVGSRADADEWAVPGMDWSRLGRLIVWSLHFLRRTSSHGLAIALCEIGERPSPAVGAFSLILSGASEDLIRSPSAWKVFSEGLFCATVGESLEDVQRRFGAWLESEVAAALAGWR